MIEDIVLPHGEVVKIEKVNLIVNDILNCLSGKGISIAAAKRILKEAELELDNMKIV